MTAPGHAASRCQWTLGKMSGTPRSKSGQDRRAGIRQQAPRSGPVDKEESSRTADMGSTQYIAHDDSCNNRPTAQSATLPDAIVDGNTRSVGSTTGSPKKYRHRNVASVFTVCRRDHQLRQANRMATLLKMSPLLQEFRVVASGRIRLRNVASLALSEAA